MPGARLNKLLTRATLGLTHHDNNNNNNNNNNEIYYKKKDITDLVSNIPRSSSKESYFDNNTRTFYCDPCNAER